MNQLFDDNLNKLDGLDPYLIWGAYTQFRGTVGPPSNGQLNGDERIQFLIECTDVFAKPWVPVNPAQPFTHEHKKTAAHRVADGKRQGDGIFSVSSTIVYLHSILKNLGGAIKRIELSTARKAPPDSWTTNVRNDVERPTATSAKNVLLIIDDGLAFLNECFRRRNGETCIAWFWDQSIEKTVFPKSKTGGLEMTAMASLAEAIPDWQPVYRFGYGRELDATTINRRIRTLDQATSERQVYRELDYSRVQRDLAHGTHVAGWACEGHEEDIDIIMVQLPPVVSWDTSGGGTAKHVCDALIYALDRVVPTANVVVNLSFGAFAGPHDGSTLLECAIDSLIKKEQEQRNIAMTLPAGNQFNARGHAAVTLKPGKSETLYWNIGKDDPTDTFCELWYEDSALVSVSLTTPLGSKIRHISAGQASADVATSGDQVTCAVIHRKTAASGRSLSQALLAVVPTRPLDATNAAAPAGTWEITITNEGSRQVVVDAWIQRDDAVLQGPYRSRQSYFSSTRVGLNNSEDDVPSDPVKRAGTGNSIAHGEETVVVGGCFADNHLLNNYTAAKPVNLARDWPDLLAPCDANRLFAGLLGQATQSGAKVRMNGTSISSSQVANKILDIFKTTSKTILTTPQLRSAVIGACKKSSIASPTALDDLRKGNGCLG